MRDVNQMGINFEKNNHDSFVTVLKEAGARTFLVDGIFLGFNAVGNDIGTVLISNPSTKYLC